VQQALRRVFARWGLPTRLRVDNGFPWGSAGDLPPDLALWLLGLGVQVVWNRPRRCQENGIVERDHGVLKAWAEPARCPTAVVLADRLTWAATMQREHYPRRGGASRGALHPALANGGQPYDPGHEDVQWHPERVWAVLATVVVVRRVDKVGRVSLYNHAYGAGRRAAHTAVQVRLDPADPQGPTWVICAEDGTELRRHPAPELSRERIVALEVTHRKPSALRRRRRPLHPAEAQLAVRSTGA
jgi:hypothetical protein